MDGFQRSHIDYYHEKSDTEGVAMRGENGGLSIFFFSATWGALKGQKQGWWGSSIITVRNFHVSYFGIMFEGGSDCF